MNLAGDLLEERKTAFGSCGSCSKGRRFCFIAVQ